jgi:hypothetical protein
VNAGQARRRLAAHRLDDSCAPIAALRDVARIPETPHEDVPRTANPLEAPARFGRLRREAKPGQRWDDDVEGVLRLAAIPRRIGERTDELDLLEHRARPAMRDDQRHRAGVTRAHVDEMNVDAVDGRRELRKCVQLRLALSPVVPGRPIPDESLELGKRRTLGSIGDGLLAGPPRRREPSLQARELRIRHLDPERADGRTVVPRTGPCWRGSQARHHRNESNERLHCAYLVKT